MEELLFIFKSIKIDFDTKKFRSLKLLVPKKTMSLY